MPYPDDRKYTKEHEWMRTTGELAEIGITDYAQAQLGDVVYVDLPEVGTSVTAGQPFGTIESVKAVSELFAPVGGEVVEVNSHVREHPEIVNSDPHATWMIKLRVANGGENSSLLDSAQYQTLLD